MDADEVRQQSRSQYIGVFMVVFGSACTALGCHFHYVELTTMSAGIAGAGINMLTNQSSKGAAVTNKAGGVTNIDAKVESPTA